MTLCIWIFNPVGIIGILASIIMGSAIYLILVFLLRGFKKQELRTLFSTIGLGVIYTNFEKWINNIIKK